MRGQRHADAAPRGVRRIRIPESPAERTDILRKAFDETMNDAEFRAEAAKLQLDINPVSGASIDTLLQEIYATPKDVTVKAARVISEWRSAGSNGHEVSILHDEP